jgi:hypothetical protein
MKTFFSNIIFVVFPFIELFIANKKVNKKITDLNSVIDNLPNQEKISTEVLKAEYENTLVIKDKLESKAKTNIFAVTISITLVMGADALLGTVKTRYASVVIEIMSLVIYIAAIIYLICAGLISIRTLMNNNSISVIELSSYASDDTLRADIDRCVSYNRNMNTIRNNAIYTSYVCIRNGLICLFVVLVLSVLPFSNQSSILKAENLDKNTLFTIQVSSSHDIENDSDIEVYAVQKDHGISKPIEMIINNYINIFSIMEPLSDRSR